MTTILGSKTSQPAFRVSPPPPRGPAPAPTPVTKFPEKFPKNFLLLQQRCCQSILSACHSLRLSVLNFSLKHTDTQKGCSPGLETCSKQVLFFTVIFDTFNFSVHHQFVIQYCMCHIPIHSYHFYP